MHEKMEKIHILISLTFYLELLYIVEIYHLDMALSKFKVVTDISKKVPKVCMCTLEDLSLDI